MPGPTQSKVEHKAEPEDEKGRFVIGMGRDELEAHRRQQIIIRREGRTPVQNAVWWSGLNEEQQRTEMERWQNEHGLTGSDVATVIFMWGVYYGLARSLGIPLEN